ncbi:MAG: type II secretion system protein F [Dorea sp.]|jgi:tight adherence protein B|nr:type II secretion system protein F [Dorea sp.]MCI9249152.1 type II secretion system protein F [Dorea sp.]
MEKRKSEFLVQFKEGIQSMAASLRAGYSVENAVKETYRELLRMYEEEEMICKEFAYMVQQIRLRIPAEEVFEELAGRVRLEDVRSFANVFAAAKRNGGDMMEIIKNTANKIGDKIDVKREIDTMLAAKRYEFRVMSVIPYAIIAYMTLSFPEFMGCLYGNVIGMGVMSVCLGIYMAAYALGAGMVEIEV